MSAWGCCGEYNEHSKNCFNNESNPEGRERLLAERDRLKAELESVLESQRLDIKNRTEVMSIVCKDRDAWKSKAEKLEEALKLTIEAMNEGQDRFHPGFFMGDIETAKEALAEFEKGV